MCFLCEIVNAQLSIKKLCYFAKNGTKNKKKCNFLKKNRKKENNIYNKRYTFAPSECAYVRVSHLNLTRARVAACKTLI